MNSLALGALALAATHPGSHDHATSDRDWLALDRDVEELANAISAADESAPVISMWMKTAYRRSEDVQVAGNDLGGFTVQGIRLTAQGKVGPFELKYGIDGASGGNVGPASTKDAFVRTPVAEGVHVQVGNFRAPFLFSGVASDDKEIFFNRSTQGALWNARELALMFDGRHGPFLWWLSGQNGGDGAGDDWLTIAKAAYSIVGDPIPPKQTGGYGVDSPTRATVGVGYAEDRSALVGDARAFSGEVTLITGRLFAHGEVVDYGDGFVPGSIGGGQARSAGQANMAEATPFGITAGFMITTQDEVALRYDDVHEVADTRVYWVGYTRYVAGHATKWQFGWTSIDSDAGDVDELLAGLTVSL